MMQKLIKSVAVSAVIVFAPAIGNIPALGAVHLWVLFLVGVAASLTQPDYHVVKGETKQKDRGTELQIIWSVFITQLAAIIEAVYLRYPASFTWDPVSVGAAAFILLGLVLRAWAIRTLGRYFTMHLAIQEGHTVISTGPYGFIRHPSYVGAFFIYVGSIVFIHSWYTLIPAILILSWAWLRRIHYEEQMLNAELGSAYADYCQRVKRAIPGLW